MNSHDTIERAQRLMGSAAHGGRWLLPWACVLVLSGSLVQASEQALVRNLQSQPLEMVATTERAASTLLPGEPVEAGTRWVLLSSVDPQGTQVRVACRTTPDRVAADALDLRPEDLDSVAAKLCTTWSTDRGGMSKGGNASVGPLQWVGQNSWVPAD